MRLSLRYFVLTLVAATGCSSSPSPSVPVDGGATDGAVDGRADVDPSHHRDASIDAAPSPDGTGVCCPAADYMCNPQQLGGWAAKADDCPGESGAFDGCPFAPSKDSHGCTVLTEPTTCACWCGQATCPGDDKDAGDGGDASNTGDASDAASDGG
jgi:hypothetical protein